MQLPGLRSIVRQKGRQSLVRQQAPQALQALSSLRPSLACPATLPLLQLHFSGPRLWTRPAEQRRRAGCAAESAWYHTEYIVAATALPKC